jgi:RND family efflux transporter MFP subunit
MGKKTGASAKFFGLIKNAAGTAYSYYEKKIYSLKIPSKFKKPRLILAIAVLLLAAVIYRSIPSGAVNSQIPVFRVKKDKFLVTITESGEIRAKNSISISAPRIRGNLKVVYLVPEGTYVKAGEIVVKFDPTEALNSLKDAESKLEIAVSDKEKLLANQKSNITRAESDLKSAELAFELSKLSLEQMKFEAEVKQQEAKLQHQRDELSFLKAQQDFKSQKIINQSELSKVEIEVRQRQADLERAKRDLEMLTLTAPSEGLVVYEINWSSNRKIQIGDTPWSGMPIISLPDLSAMESITTVNEVDVSKISKGLKVQVKLDAFQDSTYNGVIGSVASLGRAKERNSTIKVFEIGVDIKSQSEKLKPGMTTSNKMIINEIPNKIFVPQEAVFEKEGKKVIFVKNGSGFVQRAVETGEKSENYIIITKNLEDGEEVALRDPTLKIESQKKKDEQSSSVSMPAGK